MCNEAKIWTSLLGKEKCTRKNMKRKRRAKEAIKRIVATRKGRSESVEEEGRSFKAEQVQFNEYCIRKSRRKTKG